MAITTLDGLLGASKQRLVWNKTSTRTTVTTAWFSLFDIAGNPGAGTLAIGNTANGVVPTDATAGYPTINAFSGANKGYISKAFVSSSVACRIAIFDRLFACGAYAFNANTNLTSQPSYSGRLPGTDYKGLEIWVEQVTAATGNQAVNVTYTDQDGNTGATTGATGIGSAPTVGRCWQLPLASGDTGVQTITNVTGSTASAGTFNVMVLRPLLEVRVNLANYAAVLDALGTGLPEIYADSAIYCMVATDSTSSGVPEITLDIANG